MKTLKNDKKGVLAVITETTVYICMLDGQIIKHFPSQHFNQSAYTEVVDYPADFEIEKRAYHDRNVEKQAEKLRKAEAARLAAYEYRKEMILNLWNWRKGRTDVYLITTSHQTADDELSCDPEDVTRYLIFGEEEAAAKFEAMKGSENPSFDGVTVACYFVTEQSKFYTKLSETDRLQFTSFDDLEEALYRDRESIQIDRFAPSIEDCDYIITFSNRGKVTAIDERRTTGFWGGSCFFSEQTTTADLNRYQTAVTREELVNDYYSESVEFGIISEDDEF